MPDPATPPSPWTPIGYVVKPHGIRGELRLQLDVPWESLQGDVTEVRMTPRDGGAALVASVSARPMHKGVLLRVDVGVDADVQAIDSPETAAMWRGATVEVPTCHIPPCDEGEFYLAELQGVTVFDISGACLGVMQHVVDNAGQPLGTIQASDGSERLLPLVPQTIGKFERAARRLDVRVPLGLWDV